MSGAKFLHVIILTFGIMLIAIPDAHAQVGTLKQMIDTTRRSFDKIPDLLATIAYISGTFFGAAGIFKFKEHVDSPLHHPLSAGVKRFIAGGMMYSLPFVADALKTTMSRSAVGGSGISNTTWHSAATGGGMDAMIQKLIANIYLPSINILSAFAYLSAIVLMLVGIVRLTKTAQEGHRGPTGLGTIMTFLTAAGLFAFGDMIGAFSNSMFGTAAVATYAEISSDVIRNAADREKISTVVESLVAFVMIVGFVAFLRGWFVLRAFAEGNGNATVAQSLTLLFGGAVAINIGPFINILQQTVGVSGITFG